MKKTAWIIFTIVTLTGLLVFTGGCASDSPKCTADDIIGATEDLADELDDADNADAVVEAIDDYADEVAGLLKRLGEQLKDKAKMEEFKEQLGDIGERLKDAGKKIASNIPKLAKHAFNSNVRAAIKRLTGIMNDLGDGISD